MRTVTPRTVLVLGIVAAMAVTPQRATAQATWPSQQIRFIVPNPPGGLPDILSRVIAEPLRARLGQPIIIENRPGAAAGIGAAVVTGSKPDGYTFLVADSSLVNVGHHLNAQQPFDRKDLMPIVLIAKGAIFLGANTALPVKSFKEFVEHVKANPGKVNYGSIGVGSFHHLTMEAIQAELGVKLNHVPYKGSGESVTALRAGHIMVVFASYAGLLPAIKSGQAVLLAHNATGRTKQAPDVPPIADTIPGLDLAVTQSLYARTGTPQEISTRMTAVLREVVKEPAVLERFDTLGLEAAVAGSAELQRFLDGEAVRIKKVVDAAGLKPN